MKVNVKNLIKEDIVFEREKNRSLNLKSTSLKNLKSTSLNLTRVMSPHQCTRKVIVTTPIISMVEETHDSIKRNRGGLEVDQKGEKIGNMSRNVIHIIVLLLNRLEMIN